jgi:uncharacterized phiE125 gp8 family phage protein
MRHVLVTPPAIEPVTLTQAKAHCRIDSDADDTLVTSAISAARKLCENYCQRAFINQEWELFLDGREFPDDGFIKLPYGDLKSIMEITSTATDGTITSLTADDYYLSGNRIIYNENYQWPDFRTYDGLSIRYVVGFGSLTSDVPAEIRHAILMFVAHFYENREALIDPIAAQQQVTLPFGALSLLAPYRIYYL